jgi:hypothetical protein
MTSEEKINQRLDEFSEFMGYLIDNPSEIEKIPDGHVFHAKESHCSPAERIERLQEEDADLLRKAA